MFKQKSLFGLLLCGMLCYGHGSVEGAAGGDDGFPRPPDLSGLNCHGCSRNLDDMFKSPDIEKIKEDIKKERENLKRTFNVESLLSNIPEELSEIFLLIKNGDRDGAIKLLQDNPQLVDRGRFDLRGEKMNVLHIAAYFGDFNLVKYLLMKGAYVDARCRYGITPLHIAIMRKNVDTAMLFIMERANIALGNKIYGAAENTAEFYNIDTLIPFIKVAAKRTSCKLFFSLYE